MPCQNKTKESILAFNNNMYYKSTLQLHPMLSISYRVCGLMIIWKYFSIQIHNPSALQVLQGDSTWEWRRTGRGELGFPVRDFVAMRRWGSMKLFLLPFHLYTVLSNAYNINSAGSFWARTQNFFPANNVFTNVFINLHSNLTITSKD